MGNHMTDCGRTEVLKPWTPSVLKHGLLRPSGLGKLWVQHVRLDERLARWLGAPDSLDQRRRVIKNRPPGFKSTMQHWVAIREEVRVQIPGWGACTPVGVTVARRP